MDWRDLVSSVLVFTGGMILMAVGVVVGIAIAQNNPSICN